MSLARIVSAIGVLIRIGGIQASSLHSKRCTYESVV